MIFGSTPYKAPNSILKDSSVPFDLYSDVDSFMKLLTSRLDTKLVSSNPGVRVNFILL